MRADRGHPRGDAWHPRQHAQGSGPADDSGPPRERFREDIQGLRAVAVLLVLAFHLWPETLTGGYVGVDVFFVISGFLITGHLLQHPPRRARDLLEFWGRRVRRLLPAAFLVLAATAIASRLFAPETRWGATAGEIIASALYIQNWALAGSSVDYLAAEEPPTPVQHYWSLSVEEQFYLFWPVLIFGLFWLGARTGTGSRFGGAALTRVAMVVVIGASLAASISSTETEPASAYFITQTRIWELAVGGFVATLPARGALGLGWVGHRMSRALPSVAAWVGLAMIVVAGVMFSTTTPFPGSAALLPVLGTTLVIAAAATGRGSPTRILAPRPVQHIGDTSYSIYLWHWPLIVLWPEVLGPITLVGAVAIVALTLGLATLSKVFVEDAFRFAPRFQPLRPTFRFAVAGMLVLSLAGGAQLLEAQARLDQALASADLEPSGEGSDGVDEPTEPAPATPVTSLAPGASEPPAPEPTDAPPGIDTCLGAASIVRGFDACPQDPAGPMVPSPIAAATDRSDAYRDGCFNYAPFSTRRTCTYGKGPIEVALVGNSHAGQWLPAMQSLAKRNGWTVTTFIASQCNVTDAPLEFYSTSKTQGCLAWGDWVMGRTRGDAFDLVVVSERQSVPLDGVGWPGTFDGAVAGFTSYVRQWSESGAHVVVLQDTPFPKKDVGSIPDCLARHAKNQLACAGTWDAWRATDPLFAAVTATPMPGVTAVSTRAYLCTEILCPAVIGTYIAYFDGSHMTATYARSITPFIEPEVLAALGERGP